MDRNSGLLHGLLDCFYGCKLFVCLLLNCHSFWKQIAPSRRESTPPMYKQVFNMNIWTSTHGIIWAHTDILGTLMWLERNNYSPFGEILGIPWRSRTYYSQPEARGASGEQHVLPLPQGKLSTIVLTIPVAIHLICLDLRPSPQKQKVVVNLEDMSSIFWALNPSNIHLF